MTKLQIFRRTENEVLPKVAKDKTLDSIIEHLEIFDLRKELDGAYEQLQSHAPILSPQQILTLSKRLKNAKNCEDKQYYLKKLIQKSFDEGNNDFIIDNQIKYWNFPELTGTSYKKLKITYLSELLGFANRCTDCYLIAKEKAAVTGWDIKDSFIEIKQDLEELNMWNSYNSTFKIRGEIKSIRPDSKSENITIILNQEQYKKHKENPQIKNNKQITLEVLEE